MAVVKVFWNKGKESLSFRIERGNKIKRGEVLLCFRWMERVPFNFQLSNSFQGEQTTMAARFFEAVTPSNPRGP